MRIQDQYVTINLTSKLLKMPATQCTIPMKYCPIKPDKPVSLKPSG